MANKTLFKSSVGGYVGPTDTVNLAGGKAYSLPDKHALAQMVTTGCLNSTYYASAEQQLDTVLKLCKKVDPAFIAKAAI